MNIINSDTNATVAGIPVPPGAYEWPVHGTITIVPSGAASTNAEVGSTDTVLIWRGGVQVETGPEILSWFIFGLFITMSGFGVIGFGRWLSNRLWGLGSKAHEI